MSYYFNTSLKIRADVYFEHGKFNEALLLYKQAYTKLKEQSSKDTGLESKQKFIDALTYVCCDITLTSCQNILLKLTEINSTNIGEFSRLWDETQRFASEMDDDFQNLMAKQSNQTQAKFVKDIYEQLAQVAELMSDSINIDANQVAYTKLAIEWLGEAIKYARLSTSGLQFKTYLGLLCLHEHLYKLEYTQENLSNLKQLIESPSVSLKEANPVQRIEYDSYSLRAKLSEIKQTQLPATKIQTLKNQIEVLEKRCGEYVDQLRDEEKNSQLAADINELLAEISQIQVISGNIAASESREVRQLPQSRGNINNRNAMFNNGTSNDNSANSSMGFDFN